MARATLLAAAAAAAFPATLYDAPVSNHGARVRLLLYKKGLEQQVDVVSPGAIGGLRSDEYRALNPQSKM